MFGEVRLQFHWGHIGSRPGIGGPAPIDAFSSRKLDAQSGWGLQTQVRRRDGGGNFRQEKFRRPGALGAGVREEATRELAQPSLALSLRRRTAHRMTSSPPMYVRSAVGTRMVPSSC